MLIFSIICFLFFPIISIIASSFGYFFDSKRKSWVYPLLMGLSLGMICYFFIPNQTYDLYRHHSVVYHFFDQNISSYFQAIGHFDLENLPLFICYLVAKLNNVNILQFLIVSLGYFILFYLLYDYRKKHQTRLFPFLIIFLFTVFGFNTLYFISGLWFYIAILIFFLAFYLDYEKDCNKLLCYLLYFSTICFHKALLFAVAILFIYKFFKNKVSFKLVVITVSLFIAPAFILNFLNSIVDIQLLKEISYMYNAYFTQNTMMRKFYSGTIFFIEMTKLFMTVLALFLQKERNRYSEVNGFIILLSICTLFMMPQSIVMIRFIMIVQFIGIIPMLDYFSNDKRFTKEQIIYLALMTILSLVYILYFCKVFRYENFGNLFSHGIFENIFSFLIQ